MLTKEQRIARKLRLQKPGRKAKNNARHVKQRQNPIDKLIHANTMKDRRQTLEYREKRWSPEFRAAQRQRRHKTDRVTKNKDRRSSVDYKAKRNERQKLHRQKPEVKIKNSFRDSLIETRIKKKIRNKIQRSKLSNIKARKAHRQTPEYKAKQKAYRQRPDVIARRKSSEALAKKAAYIKKRRKIDIKFKLGQRISRAIRFSLKGAKSGRHWEDLVGYTANDLKLHLETLFKQNMSWNNCGNEWHIDHKIPQSWWEYSKPEDSEFKQCWCLANLQPMWAKDNIKKSNKFAGGIL